MNRVMYFEGNTFLFIILILVWTYSITKISDILKLNYRRSIFVIIFGVICFGFFYQYFYFLKLNSVPANGEQFKIKEAFLYYSFHDDGSVDVEHNLLFETNKNSFSKNSLSYIFYETNEIDSLQISLNENSMEPSVSKTPNTYELNHAADRNILTLHLPHPDSKNVNLSIHYSVKHALGEQKGALVYSNTFFPERTNFSFNTNVKGKITFRYPEHSVIRFGAHSKDFWVDMQNSNQNSFVVEFQNKLPYEKNLSSRFSDWIKLYDPASYDKSYLKDFSLLTRLDFSPTLLKAESSSFSTQFRAEAPSVGELNSLNTESNKKFSDFKFILGVFKTSWFHGNGLFLLISFPITFSYYRQQKKKKSL